MNIANIRRNIIALSILAFASLNVMAQETTTTSDDESAKAIIEKADRVRFPSEGFQVDIDIASGKTGQEPEMRKYRVLSKGNSNTVVMITEPASERGQMILMKGRDLWVFMPEVSQPIRLSLSQRLTGQVANGDLARANFAGDYNPKIVKTEKIGDETYNVLELTAVDRGVTYQKVVYWVGQSDNRPFKAEFYSLSNRLLKTCKYDKYQMMEGQMRPTRLIMDDAMKSGEQSILEYKSMKLRELPDKVFTKDYLKKLDG